MPKAFEKCVKEKGRVRRISGPNKKYKLKKGEYMNICWDKDNVPHHGETHKKKSKTKKLITPSDIPKLLKPGMKVINPTKKKPKNKHKKKKSVKSVKKDILNNESLELEYITFKSLKKIGDKALIITHHYLHRLWKNKNMDKMTIKSIIISHIRTINELKNRKIRHNKIDVLDWD